MSAVGGWFGEGRSDFAPGHALDAIAGAHKGRRCNEARVSSPAAAIWASSDRPNGFVCNAEIPWVGIVGSPRWRDPALAEEQRLRGRASALRRAYRAHGLDLFSKLVGPFAFVILDRGAGRAVLAIDRMGVHRLYYATAGSRIIFGSSADLVRAHPEMAATIPLQSIYNYLHAYVCRSPGTIYAEQQKLGPAQFLLWDRGSFEVKTYWRMPFNPDLKRDPEALGEELVARVRRAVHTSLPEGSAHGVGAFLSGGLDSSTVAGMLSELTDGPTETFTIGFDERSYDEMSFAEATARKFGARHHRYYLTPEDVVQAAPKVAAYYDEPFGNSSAIPTYFCATQAAEMNMTCLLAGDGGDEILAGNSRYMEQQAYLLYGRLPPVLRNMLKLAVFRTPAVHNTPLWKRAQRYIERSELPTPERLEVYNFYQRQRMDEVFEADALRSIDIEAPWRETLEVYENASSSNVLQRLMSLDLKQALADADLKKVTGMCELAGMDVGFPFLDDDLVEFCGTIPPELHLKGGRLRAFFKDVFNNFLPAEVIAKKKHGFGMPFYEWTRDHPALRDLAYDSLRSLRRRDLLRRQFIDEVMAQHARTETTPYDGLVWDLMMLELWLQQH